MAFITIFTPTYNRAYILPKLYESLKAQTVKDFEWLIVDDGSSDSTQQLSEQWQKEETGFPIRYIKQENAGKMQAVNKGAANAAGTMFFIVDSDDFLPENAVERIIYWENTISDKKSFAGVAGCRYTFEGDVLGSTFSGEYIDLTSLERRKHNILGDKAEVFYTEIIKKYPFPAFEGEKFVPEAVIFNRIANDGYKFRWVNENFYFCDYREDGYTKNVNSNLIKNWQGYSLYIRELLGSRVSVREKAVPALGYVYRWILRGFNKK